MPGKRRQIAKKYQGYKTVKIGRRRAIARISFRGIKHFLRTSPFSNAANTAVTGTLSKTSEALVLTNSVVGGPIQYGTLCLKFSLDNVTNSTEFTTLFDQYRIVKVVVRIVPFFSQSLTGAAATATLAQTAVLVHSCIDNDDVTAPALSDAGISEIRQFNSYRMMNITNGRGYFKRTIYPRTAVPVYGTGAFASYAMGNKKMWLDCQNPDTEHYGLKMIFESSYSGVASVLYFKCEYDYYIELKDAR